ncbi:hypothetical protein R5R35_007753 [Gryllus longicercus]|uniref:Aminopeptidase n=1 Tax=Gryllus longicercus TaxID=2509291 RepID=A0AAN9Z163_9ORTH
MGTGQPRAAALALAVALGAALLAAWAPGAEARARRSIDLSADLGRPSDSRLPEGLVPSHYRLRLQPFLTEARFQGRVRVNLTCEASTRAVHLHAHEALHIAHDGVRVWWLGGAVDASSSEEELEDADTVRQQLSIASTKKDTIQQQYVIFLTQNLTEGDSYEVELTFSGPLNDERSEAFFMNSYEDHRTKGRRSQALVLARRPYAATQMRPNNARRVFPCFDGPNYKATFDISVVRPARMAALSNMPVRLTEKLQSEPGWEVDHFQTTPPMSTFSVAVVVSDLGYITPLNPLTAEGGPQIRVFGRAHFLGRLQAAADAAPAALAFLQDYLGVPFPLPGLDLVVLPHYAARHPADMWGVVIFREEDLVGESMQVQLTTELAYQWLGHLVTPAPRWAELHLNKALVNLLMVARLQGVSPIFSPGNLATRDHSLYYEYSKKHPYAVVKSQKETIRLMKSQWVLRMINNTITEKTFKSGLQHFVQERQYNVFEEADMFSTITHQGWADGTVPRDVQLLDVVNSWVQRDRYPAITVTRNYNDATAEVEQHVFLRDRPRWGCSSCDDDDLQWWVPLPLLAQGDLDLSSVQTMGWLHRQQLTLRDLPAAPNEFIIVNPNEMGMYMVNYDPTNWQLLAAYLEASAGGDGALAAVDVGSRAKLLHDAWNLALAGELAFGAALNMTLFLPRETEFAVWDTFFTMVDHVGRHTSGTPAGDKFQAYVCRLVEPLHAGLAAQAEAQGTPAPRDPRDRSDPVATLRALAKYVLCSAGCAPCREQAQFEFARWMEMDDPEEGNPVADLYLCPVFAWGTDEQWEFGLQRVINFPKEREPEERNMLLAKVAGCARDPLRIERILNASILETDSNFTISDVRNIANVLAGNAYGHAALFSFLSEHWDAVKERCSEEPGMWEYFVSRALSNFKTQEGLDLVSELYVSRMGQFGPAEPIVEEALKTIKEEAEWSNENLPDMEHWLDAHLDQ